MKTRREGKELRVLIITGQLAEDHVKKCVEESPVDVEVLALPISVAALLSPTTITQELKNRNLKGFHLILVPGLVRGDVSNVGEAVGIPTVKGPKYSADLPPVMRLIDHVKLSSTHAADEVVAGYHRQRASNDLEVSREARRLLLKRPGNLLIGGVEVGKDFPLRVMAEILDVPLLSDNEIFAKAEYYVESGADVIDIGMISGESHPKDASRVVKVVKDSFNLPVSIDTFDVDEARAGVDAGVDMVLSVDGGNVEEVAEFASDTPVVVTPTNQRRGYLPRRGLKRVEVLEDNVRQAINLGLKKVVGDLILNPLNTPGIMESLVAYHEFSRRNPDIPLLFGAGNVTELIDADSVGVNALLAGVAAELKASIVLTTEGSSKTRGSVRELAVASKMMVLAKKRCSVPKDLGIDLLVLKDKRLKEAVYDRRFERDARILEAERREGEAVDPKGFFRILIDRREGKLVAINHLKDRGRTIIKGDRAEDITSTIINMKLVSSLAHASYLGRELEKAETALRIGKNYIQDEPLFLSHVVEWT
jgi:dihydropteroate synthase-like protein